MSANVSVAHHQQILYSGINDAYKNGLIKSKELADMNERMHFETTHGCRLNYDPHVNGFFYVFMQPGTWLNTYLANEKNPEILMSDTKNGELFGHFYDEVGMCAYDIDIPALNIEYESFSSRTKNLNHATKVSLTGDFSIKYLETQTMTNFRHHAAWLQYIEALKKGYFSSPDNPYSDTSEFVPMSYYNNVWVVLFDKFGTNIRGCVKIMGVSPVNFPIKDVMGDRAQGNISTVTCNYKCNDMVYTFFEGDADDALIKEANEAFQSVTGNSGSGVDIGGGGPGLSPQDVADSLNPSIQNITTLSNTGGNSASLSDVTADEFDQMIANEFDIDGDIADTFNDIVGDNEEFKPDENPDIDSNPDDNSESNLGDDLDDVLDSLNEDQLKELALDEDLPDNIKLATLNKLNESERCLWLMTNSITSLE